ncbi:choline transporter [Saccharomyces cerevisiae]|nr:Hnm1p [Saccharomyces cerevisiae YJM195]AJR82976.1 Hnm1p [Saccharomyces cerevisiae YJM470]AJR86958.1 Hnm1p [Saccharomyces cerevisiae YJM689]AJR96766.1 Hnm1p [Saccharomyces cerevisiae YJM1248]AJS01246.1 Hnm1p [Saccharomyces cerevisiae YJM1439]AJS02226.1 Hnm1p [Saccharomyces cerevisiae YJM1444]AJS05630.1 Hnm1p [Saccharomyces cerevisiae YJM1479]AJS23259.1 Hnm1p [Saccharomyces cerevisiae YJM1342]AJS23756.1 Hnm1p [Saccharomyces cerevisiae YJM1355]AJS24751.1 Hnm1p [Saccharomyces cerevisiae YJM
MSIRNDNASGGYMQPDQSSNASMHKRDLRVEEEIKPLDDMDSKGAVAADGEVHLRKSFSLWSILGVGFGLTNSWFGISTSMVAGISSGGPMMIVYGIIIVALISICIGTSLGELSSAYPHAGGQFWWSLKLAPPKYKRFAAYMCGSFAYAGSVFTSASTTLSVATEVVGMYALTHPEFIPKRWHIFVCFELLHLFLMLFNCYGKSLPIISSSSLYISLLSFFTITITVLACSHGKFNDAKFVFATFNNETGWKNGGIAFIVGLINPAWSFSCLDCATHMAFEVEKPERVIPIAIMGTVAIGFVTSFCYVIAMFFSIQDLDAVLSSTTGAPILDIYNQALGNKSGAIFLGCLILFTSFGCVIACHTWQARLCWSFARDNGLPLSRLWSQVNPHTGVPLNAHLMSCAWITLIGLLYLASSTAFQSLITGCIAFLLLSYIIPVICLLAKKRNIAHGPFWLGKFGFFSNIVLLGWTVFSVVFFSFPPVLPVTKDNMNYVCVVIVGYTAYSILYWKYKGKKEFHALEESENEQAEYSNNFDTIEDSREFSVAASDVELENEHVPWGKK